MNVIFLSPHFPPNFYSFCVALKEAGANVLAIGDASYDSLRKELKESITEYYRVNNMENYEELLRAVAFFTHKYGKIDKLDSNNEHWLEKEARLREDFNIFGIKTNELDKIKRKSHMKKIFNDANIKTAKGKVVHTIDEAKELIKETGYPVVAKPDIGVGAVGTYKINNDKELSDFFQNKADVDYIMEEFLRGIIFSFDGLSDRDSNVFFYTSHVYSQGVMETINDDSHISYWTTRKIPKNLVEIGLDVVKAFNTRERFFHFEFFNVSRDNAFECMLEHNLDNDEFVALEVNMRAPGGFTPEMINLAHNINIYRMWADMVVHHKNEVQFERDFYCSYSSRKHRNNYVHPHNKIMKTYRQNIVFHAHIPDIFSKGLGDEGYVFRARHFSHIKEIHDFIHKTI